MPKDKVIIIGASRLGSFLARDLADKGVEVVVIDKRDKSFNKLLDSFQGAMINADATNIKLLEEAGIKEAAKLFILTDDDNVNIFLAHACFYIYNIRDIIIRLIDNDKAVLLDNTPIKAIYPFLLSKEALDKFLGDLE